MPKRAPRPSEVFAARVREVRLDRGLTQAGLTERLKRLGLDLHPTAITKIEKGDRSVGLDEFLLLAAALNVPPPMLLLPLGTEDRVAITKLSHIHPHLALDWIAGRAPLSTTDRKAINIREWHEAAEPIRLFMKHRDLQEDVHAADSAVRSAEYVENEKQVALARASQVKALTTLHELRKSMRGAGLTAPRLPEEWITTMALVGLVEEEAD